MKFARLYPIEFTFRGVVEDGENLNEKQRLEKTKEYLKKSTPAIIAEEIKEMDGLESTSLEDYVYRVKGYSTDRFIRE